MSKAMKDHRGREYLTESVWDKVTGVGGFEKLHALVIIGDRLQRVTRLFEAFFDEIMLRVPHVMPRFHGNHNLLLRVEEHAGNLGDLLAQASPILFNPRAGPENDFDPVAARGAFKDDAAALRIEKGWGHGVLTIHVVEMGDERSFQPSGGTAGGIGNGSLCTQARRQPHCRGIHLRPEVREHLVDVDEEELRRLIWNIPFMRTPYQRNGGQCLTGRVDYMTISKHSRSFEKEGRQ